jgi:CRISPR-associated protein Csm1
VNTTNEVVVGALLHDIGKMVQRADNAKIDHSSCGFNFIKDFGFVNDSILDCIRYHHKYIRENTYKNSIKISDENLSFIVCLADHLSAADRRNRDEDEIKFGINIKRPLASIFDSVYKDDKTENKFYSAPKLDMLNNINYPDKETDILGVYITIKNKFKSNFNENLIKENGINSLLSLLESLLSFVPSSTLGQETNDISLYDHLKTTAMFAACILEYCNYNKVTNYHELIRKEDETKSKDMFLLSSFDISGIQNFIYKVEGEKPLKKLRTRSVYLQILSEHIADTIVESCGLCRTNIIYTGGGHAYILLPNTENAKENFDKIIEATNQFFIKNFGNDLFVAGGYIECSGNDLSVEGNFNKTMEKLQCELFDNKSKKNTIQYLQKLNNEANTNLHERECKECGRTSEKLEENEECSFCKNIKEISSELMQEDYFAVKKEIINGLPYLPLPFDSYLQILNKKEVLDILKNNKELVRIYSKNNFEIAKDINLATHIFMGDYSAKESNKILTLEDFAKKAEEKGGVNRIAILRADVDNLGKTFKSGISKELNCITRMSVLSRNLTLFFQYYINELLNGKLCTVIYSGGDDLFIVGELSDILSFVNLLRESFRKFTIDKLSFSTGIGLFGKGFPTLRFAKITEELQSSAKHSNENKNSLCIFDENLFIKWNDYNEIKENIYFFESYFIKDGEGKGNGFLYKLLSLLKKCQGGEKIYLARLYYYLGRMQPTKESNTDGYERIKNMFIDAVDKEKKYKTISISVLLYIYLNRNKGEINEQL